MNWLCSFAGLTVDTEASPVWAVILMVAWFAVSSIILQYACKRGWLDRVMKQSKLRGDV
jgi:hypothetical protein